MKRATRPDNEYYKKGRIMEGLLRKTIKKYRDQHIGYMTDAEIAEKLGVDASTVSRKFKEDGHSLFFSDVVEWAALIGVSPVEFVADVVMEYEVQKRTGDLKG